MSLRDYVYYEEPGITLYCGDCREILPGLRADVVVSDPPYAGPPFGPTPQEWLPLARQSAPLVTLTCGVRYVFDYPRPDWIMSWVRLGSTQRSGAMRGFNNWEPILVYGLMNLSNDVLNVPHVPYIGDPANGHPTPKPLRLLSAWLSRLPAGSVLDPFSGSGTTILAAKNLGRHAIGIEIEPKYCEIAVKRLRQEGLAFV